MYRVNGRGCARRQRLDTITTWLEPLLTFKFRWFHFGRWLGSEARPLQVHVQVHISSALSLPGSSYIIHMSSRRHQLSIPAIKPRRHTDDGANSRDQNQAIEAHWESVYNPTRVDHHNLSCVRYAIESSASTRGIFSPTCLGRYLSRHLSTL